MSMFNDISWDRKDNKDECLRNAESVKVFARRFGIGQWSFNGPGSEKKWYSSENSPQGAWDNIAEQMLLEFAESGHPTFRATTPLSSCILKSKGRGKLSFTKPIRKKLNVAIGGSTRMWHISIQYPQGTNPNLKVRLSTMQRLKRAEDKKKQEATAQPSSSSSSWHWQSSWWESDYEHSPQKW